MAAQTTKPRRSWGKVRRLPSKAWQASYVYGGQRYTGPQTYSTKGAAEAWLASEKSKIDREVWRAPSALRAEAFGEYAEVWLSQRRTRKGTELRPRTREWYAEMLSRGLTGFNGSRLADISPAMVRAWHAKRTRDSGATQAGGEARLLRAVLNTALRDGLVPVNPVPSELCRTTTGREHRPPTDGELAALIEAMAPRLRLAVQLAAFGGLRLSEWRALRRSDLRMVGDRYVVSIERQANRIEGAWVVGPPKSEDGVRQVSLPAWLTTDVRAHLDTYTARDDDALLFVSGGAGEFIDQAWRKAWDKARDTVGVGREVREHDLRHHYGTSLAEAGATAMQLKSAMGHASINTSMLYVKAARGASAEVADLLTRPVSTVRPPGKVR